MRKIRVLLADDHQGILAEIRRELGTEFEVVAEVGNGQDAVDAALTLDPDVLVTDISMPVMDGLQAAACLRAKRCRAKVIFLTIHEDPDFLDAAFSVGAFGYVTKARLSVDLVHAIREALLGNTFVSPG